MPSVESFTDTQNERQAKIDRIKLLGISQRGLERVLITARKRNKAREDESMTASLDAAANARRPELVASE